MSPNSYWFLGLSFLSLSLLIYVCVKKNGVRALLLFLILTQIAYLFETVVYIFLSSYEYHPKLIKHSTYYDSNMGSLTSNLFAVPVLATFSATYRLRWIWNLVLIVLLAVVEWLFMKLQIYTHYWWRIQYTSIGLLIYFPMATVIYKRLIRPVNGWLHTLFLYLGTAPIVGTLHIIPIMFFLNRYYLPGWFSDRAHDTTAFASIYYLCGTFIIVAAVKLKWKFKWMRLILLPSFFVLVTITLKRAGILYSLVWWDPWYYILFPLFVLIIAEAISKQLEQGPPPSPEL